LHTQVCNDLVQRLTGNFSDPYSNAALEHINSLEIVIEDQSFRYPHRKYTEEDRFRNLPHHWKKWSPRNM